MEANKEMMDIYDENKIKTGKVINREDRKRLSNNEYTGFYFYIFLTMTKSIKNERIIHMNNISKKIVAIGGGENGRINKPR